MIRLADLQACFEGVIPSIVATAAADGTPNISYLSQVIRVDDDHVGLSNQFFSKTAANIRENPHAAVLLVDARSGEQYRLSVTFVESRGGGEVFEHVRSHIEAASAQTGMAGIFRLRAIDVYRVNEISRIVCAAETSAAETAPLPARLAGAARVVRAVANAAAVDTIIDAALDSLRAELGYQQILLLTLDRTRAVLTTLASRGYERTGVGSEVPMGEGLIGLAAAEARALRVSDLSRVQRFAAAVRDTSHDENRTRTIALPGIPEAMSQIAAPLMAQGQVLGVLFAESRTRFTFTAEDESALVIVAGQIGAALALAETLAEDPQELSQASAGSREPKGAPFQVTHHVFDDSVFIDNEYLIKGVSGRLLVFFLETYRREGRRDFTNRELRLAKALRLPDIKDNLETRLLLLRRRLEERRAPVRLAPAGRGRVALHVLGEPSIEHVQG